MDYSDTTVVVPVKDEPATEKVVKSVLRALPGCRALVIYKGSPYIKMRHVGVAVVQQRSTGKGRALVEAAGRVHTPITCFIDGDGTYEARDLRKLVALVRSGADMAIGNRMGRVTEKTMPGYVQLGNRVLTLTGNLMFGLKLKDSQTGLRAIRTAVFKKLGLREVNFGVESEMNIKCKKLNCKIVEIPTSYYVRVGTSNMFKPFGGVRLFLMHFKLLLMR